MISSMALEFILMLMEEGTKVNGKKTKRMERVYLLGRMVTDMKESI